MWRAWQEGQTDAARFYDDFYKRSSLKATMQKPSAEEYLTALKEQNLLGSTREQDVASSRTGYPLEQSHQGRGMLRSRIYLNPHPMHVVDVYRFVKDSIHPLPGVMWIKLADHATAMAVRDVIVIYLSAAEEHAGTETVVVNLLVGYQAAHPRHFIDEVPRLTARLPGVGIGAEPPTREALAGLLNRHLEAMSFEERSKLGSAVPQFSFSSYRSALIVRAIQDAGGRLDTFQALVADYLNKAGVDPSDPAQQHLPDPSVFALLGMVWPKQDENEKEKETEA